jgi:hypothetical protein
MNTIPVFPRTGAVLIQAKGWLSRFVYCEWKVKRIPQGKWNSAVCMCCWLLVIAISGCWRKNCWVSSNSIGKKGYHVIKARILAI